MSSTETLKQIAPFLDPHLLLFTLQKTSANATTGGLQTQIKNTHFLSSHPDKAKKLEEAAKNDAQKLLDVLNGKDFAKLREEHKFTLESLKKEKNINISDCHALQKYAKVLYEQGKYKDAEKLLYSLKEIIVNEANQNADLMLQVFWGLLACQILNNKGRDNVENTTLKKMKDLIEKKSNDGNINEQEHLQLYTWILHWLLVYSFTAKDLSNQGIFATILTQETHGSNKFLEVVQMRSKSLSKYMIASLILARGQPNTKYQVSQGSLEEVALPSALINIKEGNQDVFSLFLQAIYEDYDLDKAIGLVDEMAKYAEGDFLLNNYVFDIKKQAYLLIFQTKCKLFRTVDVNEISKVLSPLEPALEDIQRNLQAEGFQTEVSKQSNTLSCTVKRRDDVRVQLQTQAYSLFCATSQLNEQYQKETAPVKSTHQVKGK